ncbi:MAG TPA: peptidoglycan editing factor PgeF [Marinobacter sp.]|nr:peptidoglycan editing factor PgeF [Marinobacter sp.]
MSSELSLIKPEWPAPGKVTAFTTTRTGGVSGPPWNSLNLGDHVDDSAEDVRENRALLAQVSGLQERNVAWLRQVHGVDVAEITHQNINDYPEADASFTREPGLACAILSADCLPVVLCDQTGSLVGAAHAGWRSLCGGVLENLITRMEVPAHRLIAWLGPAIGPNKFEVGPEVRDAFIAYHSAANGAFVAEGAKAGHYMADIYELARQRLQAAGVRIVSGGGLCTVTDATRFYSYRRDGQTGRMATLVWMR